MSELDCPLTDDELIKAVMTMNADLARTGAKTWKMHIPVDLRRDSDILIAEIARRFRDLKATMPPNDGWIPVTERLPDENLTVLVCERLGVVYIDRRINIGKHWGNKVVWDYGDDLITHWMPLPKGEKHE